MPKVIICCVPDNLSMGDSFEREKFQLNNSEYETICTSSQEWNFGQLPLHLPTGMPVHFYFINFKSERSLK